MKNGISSNFVFDDTLRHLYIAIRNRGDSLVAIRFIHKGKKWEADTAEEAVRLRKELEREDVREVGLAQQMRASTLWTPDTFWNFVQTIGVQQKKAVAALFNNQSLWAADIAEAVGVDEDALGGVLSGLSKQLKTLELKPSDLYQVHTDWSDGQRRRLFFLQPDFRLSAEEAGWPEERSKNAASTNNKRK
jgi:hypothetical protein